MVLISNCGMHLPSVIGKARAVIIYLFNSLNRKIVHVANHRLTTSLFPSALHILLRKTSNKLRSAPKHPEYRLPPHVSMPHELLAFMMRTLVAWVEILDAWTKPLVAPLVAFGGGGFWHWEGIMCNLSSSCCPPD
jgi:hypothetical protein